MFRKTECLDVEIAVIKSTFPGLIFTAYQKTTDDDNVTGRNSLMFFCRTVNGHQIAQAAAQTAVRLT